MVLDGNTSPVADLEELSIPSAKAANQRIESFLASCELSNNNVCGVEDARGCVNGLHSLLKDHARDVRKTFDVSATRLQGCQVEVLQSVKGNYTKKVTSPGEPSMALIAQTGGDKDGDGFVMPCLSDELGNGLGCESKPSVDDQDDFFFPGFKHEVADYANLVAVRTQDYVFAIYSEDEFVDRVVEINRKYPGAGTQIPATQLAREFGQAYYTPNTTPSVPLGNPQQTGIVAGQLYDPATNYYWTQLMRQNFPLSSLLTSRSVNHGIGSARANGKADPACQAYIQRYFKYGEVDFVDGHVCESDSITDSCSITDVMSGERCLSSSSGAISTE
ncbi:hypothetical protein THAOC_28331 [Thalassiosira oceanica]|uniref:Peptidase S33 tripeptidyl aminopeptidase-like C-terminal domain-containing protein n=1 Tax=Thalassiosira oceanica TaxID=159749 RepID=K0S0I5_THAOC|nr:hypothetical protein THAOC_28331 [Thalassiosira oceanica]|eukprot:EJK52397.1 hypothetical protein THAOC_28331 [Thalassiosira oceanica]